MMTPQTFSERRSSIESMVAALIRRAAIAAEKGHDTRAANYLAAARALARKWGMDCPR